jgi:hypothetical protein
MPQASNAACGSCFNLNTVCFDKRSAFAMSDRLGGRALSRASLMRSNVALSYIGRLAAKVSFRLAPALVVDASALRGFRGVGLGLGCRCHERNQRITYRLLHRVACRAVEGHPVNDRPDNDAASHELAYRVAHVSIVAAEAVNPPDDQRIPSPQHIEQPASLGALGKPSAGPGHAFVSKVLCQS